MQGKLAFNAQEIVCDCAHWGFQIEARVSQVNGLLRWCRCAARAIAYQKLSSLLLSKHSLAHALCLEASVRQMEEIGHWP